MTLLNVKDVTVGYQLGSQWLQAVDQVSFQLRRGETLGLVGESGCGKTTLAFALLRLLPSNGRILNGQIFLNGEDLLSLTDAQMRRIRWARVSMIFQSSMNSLNPVLKVKDFLSEALRTHEGLSEEQIEERIRQSFEQVGLPASRMNSYPHELSGGMKQRVVIALSLLCNPDLIIADEPTTALDVVIQDQIMARLKALQKELNFSLILVSHDVALIAENCDRVAVMYAGQIVEYADSYTIFKKPHHPYTIGLMKATPSMSGPRQRRLEPLKGYPPDLVERFAACRFQPRCPISEQICTDGEPPFLQVKEDHHSLCHFADDRRVVELRQRGEFS